MLALLTLLLPTTICLLALLALLLAIAIALLALLALLPPIAIALLTLLTLLLAVAICLPALLTLSFTSAALLGLILALAISWLILLHLLAGSADVGLGELVGKKTIRVRPEDLFGELAGEIVDLAARLAKGFSFVTQHAFSGPGNAALEFLEVILVAL